MSLVPPLPETVRNLVHANSHPGLALDKYAQSWDEHGENDNRSGSLQKEVQGPTVEEVVRLSQAEPLGLSFRDLCRRRMDMLGTLGAMTFQMKTTGPMTLHLARSSALENAGICLHHVYGFVYLPGSGIKGMARSFAETVWLPSQDDQRQAWDMVEEVFGWSPHSNSGKNWVPEEATPRDGSGSGSVVFHDAWPTEWPRLVKDITNCHHPDYYQGNQAPGDWENPIPVTFLAVAPGSVFSFAVSRRAPFVPEDILELARSWLTGALCHSGAGAKSAAGYGAFRPVEGPAPKLESPRLEQFETRLELATPAFLAGANQKREDCDLRPATLRGLLRWWWRTMHSGFVDVDTLRAMEASVFGDTNTGGALRVTVEKIEGSPPSLYNYKDRYGPTREFKQAHDLQNPPKKTSQGLFYVSYGMDEKDKQRFYMEPGAKWSVRLTARYSRFHVDGNKDVKLTPDDVLDQGRSALWLLCQYGGVGSRSRKGFGSFTDIEGLDQEKCREIAGKFRKKCGVNERKGLAESASLEHMQKIEVGTPWQDPWFALDQVGFAYQHFVKNDIRNKNDKIALGLPRGKLKHKKSDREYNRFASPVFFHLSPDRGQGIAVRVTAFHMKDLPDIKTSKRVLGQLLEHLEGDLAERAARFNGPSAAATARQAPAPHPRPAVAGKRPHGTPATVTILGPKGKGYRVQEKGKPEGSLTLGAKPDPLPDEGQKVQVYVHNDDPRNPQYTWDRPAPKKGKTGGKRGGRR